jgi:membrane protease YdiL (CAAX protease family)
MLIPGLGAMAYFDWLGDHPLAQPTYAATKVFILLWPILATLLILKRPIRLGLKPISHHLKAIPLGLAIGLPIAGLMWLWMQVPFLAEVVQGGADGVQKKVTDLGFLDHFIPFALYVTLFHSLLEEYFWRWFVYGNLRKVISRPAAHLIAGIAFTLHHIAVTIQFFPIGWALFFSFSVGVGGIFWSRLYQKQKTLVGAWASHAVVDAALMILGWHLLQT